MRFANLDLLRLFLALEVVVGHLRSIYRIGDTPEPIPAVAAFVCISGFLIPGSLAHSRGYVEFAWKRICRVVPAFVLSLLLVAALFGAKHIGGTLLYYLTLGVVGATYNPPLWSLMLEEILYAFHAASRMLFNPKLVTGLLTILTLATLVHHPIFRYKIGIAACFFAGNLLYLNRDKLSRISWAPCAACIAFIFFGLPTIRHFISGYYLQPLQLLAAVSGVVLALRAPSFEVQIPDLSYGTYAYHWPIVWFAKGLGLSFAVQFAVTVPAVLVLATGSWYLIESRALKYKNRLPRLRRWGRTDVPEAAIEAV